MGKEIRNKIYQPSEENIKVTQRPHYKTLTAAARFAKD